MKTKSTRMVRWTDALLGAEISRTAASKFGALQLNCSRGLATNPRGEWRHGCIWPLMYTSPNQKHARAALLNEPNT